MLLKKINMENKTNFFLLIFSALLFSYFFTLTFNKQKNLSYQEYDILINNSLDKKYDTIKKHILNKVYGDLFQVIENNQRFSLYHRYPDVDYWRDKGILHSKNNIQTKEVLIRYEKNLAANTYFACEDSILYYNKELTKYGFDKILCLRDKSLWLEFNDNREYVDFINQNIEVKKANIINHKFFFLRCFFIFLFFFLLCFFLFKKINYQNKI